MGGWVGGCLVLRQPQRDLPPPPLPVAKQRWGGGSFAWLKPHMLSACLNLFLCLAVCLHTQDKANSFRQSEGREGTWFIVDWLHFLPAVFEFFDTVAFQHCYCEDYEKLCTPFVVNSVSTCLISSLAVRLVLLYVSPPSFSPKFLRGHCLVLPTLHS